MTRQRHRRPILLMFSVNLLCITLVHCSSTFVFADDVKKGDAKPAVPGAPDGPDQRRLKDMLENFLGPKKNSDQRRNTRSSNPAGASDDARVGGFRDPIENRAPRNSKVEQLLKAADGAIQQKNFKVAIGLYQRLLDQTDETLHRLPNGRWQGVRQTVNQKLGELPESTLAEYRSQYGGLARQQLMAAQRNGQTLDFVQVATRFFHTPSGYEAAHYLALHHFDRLEFSMAAKLFSDLAASPAEFTRQDSWLLQAALALSKAGDTSGSQALLMRLSQGPATPVSLGNETAVNASEWLDRMQFEISLPVSAFANWTQIYGTAARIGTAVGGDALLSPNWSLPLTSSLTVSNMVKGILGDLQDQQRALVLAAQPLVIEGNVVYRDLRGLRSVDLETGHAVWEGVEGVSPERILGGLPSQQVDPQDSWRFQNSALPNISDYQGQSAEYSPLTSLLFRDGTYGLISSDGIQAFVIEDHGILSARQPGGERWGWEGNTESHDLFGVPWKTNRLVSYELKTGRVLWNLGGSESHETFDPPLAGSYFYGTPAVSDDELYLVAGKGDEIRLWALDRRTGAPKWSQLIAYADTKIDLDVVRRWNTSQVAVGSGVVVCPTTVGWLVGIDQSRQSIIWAHRYAPRTVPNHPEREMGAQLLPQKELNAQWCPSAPVICGRYVVFTPQDEPLLVCLNVSDGQRLWEKPKETGIYLAGVFDQKVVIVGETGVNAFQLANGDLAWTTKFDDGIRASGRGVAVRDRFYLPLSNGELQAFALGTGRILSHTYVGSSQPPLGNLAMHHGRLVSLSPTSLSTYEQSDAVVTDIQQRLAVNSHDGGALLRSSEIHLLNRQYSEALTLLRQIPSEQLTVSERDRHHAALVECLSTLIHKDVLHRGGELEEFERIALSHSDRLILHELTAEKLLAEQKPVEAFEVFCKLAEESGESFVTRTEDRHISSKRSVWLSGRMSEIWAAAGQSDRERIDQRIQSLIQDAAERDVDAYQRVAALFTFHPDSIAAREQFVERLVKSGDISGARIVLQQLFEHTDRAVAARATERLARLMVESHLPDDAVYYYELLESKFADVIVHGEQTGALIAAAARVASERDFEPKMKGVLWNASQLRLEHSVMNYTPPPQDIVFETPLPYFSRLSLESYPSEQRLSVESLQTGAVEWMTPLRGAVRANEDAFVATSLIGHQMYFINRGTLHALSPIEKRIIWSKTIDESNDGNLHARHDGRPQVTTMITPRHDDSSTSLLLQQAHSTGPLSIVQSNYLCLQGRRSLTVLDPRTGGEFWKLDGLPMNAQVVGNQDAVFVYVAGKNEAFAYRAKDGKPLEIPGLSKLLNDSMVAHGSSLLLFEQGGLNPTGAPLTKRMKASKCSLKLLDPITRKINWQREFPAGTVVSPLGQFDVVAVQSDWQVRRMDIETGQMTSLEAPISESISPLKSGLFLEKYLLTDEDRIYLVVNRMDNDPQTFAEGLASVRVNGWIFVWSRQDNRFLWREEVKAQNMVVDRFSKLPVLLFVSRSWKQRRRVSMNIGELMVRAIHKQTGETLINASKPAAYSAFHALSINGEDRSIDLKSYNVRLRLVSAENTVPAENDAPLPPPAKP